MTAVTAPHDSASPVASPSTSYGRTWRVGILVATAVAVVVAAFASPRQPQAIHYFDFADGRRLAGVPNALNVISNLAFLVVFLDPRSC